MQIDCEATCNLLTVVCVLFQTVLYWWNRAARSYSHNGICSRYYNCYSSPHL